jgi:hypothetical protein
MMEVGAVATCWWKGLGLYGVEQTISGGIRRVMIACGMRVGESASSPSPDHAARYILSLPLCSNTCLAPHVRLVLK